MWLSLGVFLGQAVEECFWEPREEYKDENLANTASRGFLSLREKLGLGRDMAHFAWLRAGGWHFYKQKSLMEPELLLKPSLHGQEWLWSDYSEDFQGKAQQWGFLKDFGSSLCSSDFLLKVFVGDCITLTDNFEIQEAHPHGEQAHLGLSRALMLEIECSFLPWVLPWGGGTFPGEEVWTAHSILLQGHAICLAGRDINA